jgi:ketosteroid isomerase-like protein
MSQLADLVQRYYDIFNRRDFAAYDRLFTPDCLIQAPGVELTGIEGARAFDKVWLTALPDGQIVNLAKATGGNVVMCENRFRGTHTGPLVTATGTLPPSGRAFDEKYVAVFELEGERIKRQTLQFDALMVAQKLGPADHGAANIATVRVVYDSFGRQDMAAILAVLDDSVSWGIDSVAAAEVAPYGIRHGKAGVAAFFAAWGETAEFHRFEATDFHAHADAVYCTLTYEATIRATGKRVANASPQHWTVVNGKITRWRGYEDTAKTRDAFRR